MQRTKIFLNRLFWILDYGKDSNTFDVCTRLDCPYSDEHTHKFDGQIFYAKD